MYTKSKSDNHSLIKGFRKNNQFSPMFSLEQLGEYLTELTALVQRAVCQSDN